jgi:hypothetical protein
VLIFPADSTWLDGRASGDPDGKLVEWAWTSIGSALINIVNPVGETTVVTGLDTGIYLFELKVTDDMGLSGKDTLRVTVLAPGEPNRPPVANAGADTSITLPANTVILDGRNSRDPDNNIVQYNWLMIFGRASPGILHPDSARTIVKDLVYGEYQFELRVTDAGGLISRDTLRVWVNAACEPANRPLAPVHLIPVGKLSIPRSIYTIATGGSKILFAGGSTAGGARSTSRVDIYDLQTQHWSVAELSQARIGMVAASSGNKILFAGGEVYPGFGMSSRVDIYDLQSDTWSTAELSLPRLGAKAAVLGEKIFFVDGEVPGSLLTSRVDIYDASANTWSTAELSVERGGMAVAVAGSKVLFAGGGTYGFGFEGLSDRVDIYDLASNSWSISNLSQGRRFITATSAGGKIFFAGGQTNNGLNASIDIYDNITGSWSQSGLIEPKMFMFDFFRDGKIYWAGGQINFDEDDPVYTCRVEIRDIQSQGSATAYLQYPGIGSANRVVFSNNKIGFVRREQFDIYDPANNRWSVGQWPRGTVPFDWIDIGNGGAYVVGLIDGNGSFPGQVWKLEF